MARARSGYGLKNGERKGRKAGGRGRNQTDKCRHPSRRKK